MSAFRPGRTGWRWLLLLGATLSGCGWVDSGVDKNKPPVPADDVYTTSEEGTLPIGAAEGVLANDTDGGSAPLKAQLVQGSGPSHATSFEFHEDGSFTYVHDGGESTEDSFSYTASDGVKTSIPKIVKITITPVNDPPEITDQNDYPLVTPEDTPIDISSHLLVADPDNSYPDDFTVWLAKPGDNANYSADGSIVTPATNYNGDLTVTVSVEDSGHLYSNPFPLVIKVTPVNDAPVISGQQALATLEDVPLTLSLGDLTVSDPDNSYPSGFTLAVHGGPNYSVSGTTITPAANYNGAIAVAVTVKDGIASSPVFNLVVNVTPVNDAPMANGDINGITEDGATNTVSGNVRANDTDLEEATTELTVTKVDGTPTPAVITGTYGSLSLNADGSYTYTLDNADPDTNGLAAGAVGSDGFTYTLQDTGGATATGTLAVSITGTNDAPVITSQNPVSTSEDTPLGITLAHLNVSDVDNAYPSGFTLSVQAGNDYTVSGTTITPKENYYGTLAVPVTVNDGTANSPIFNLMVDVTSVNDIPEIIAQIPAPVSTAEDTPLTINLGNLTVTDLDNTYPTDFTLTVQPGTNYTVDATGTTITPATNYNGPLTVPVTVNDGADDSEPFNLAVSVTAVNDAPTFTSLPVTGATQDSPYSYSITTDDPDAGNTLNITVTAKPDWLSFTDTGNGTATLSGTPTATDVGDHSVILKVTDDGSPVESATQSFTITVSNVNDAPTANPDGGTAFTTDEDSSFTTGSVLTNDTDPDNGDTLSVQSIDTTGTLGAVTNNGNGTFGYNPNGKFEELAVGSTTTDSFQYTVTDGNGGTSSATVTITINGINDAPLANPDANSVTEDDATNAANGNVRDNDTDVEDATTALTVTQVGGTATPATVTGTYGGLSLNADGSYTYTLDNVDPDTDGLAAGEVRSDAFTYTLRDTEGATTPGTLTISVTGANDAPVASPGCHPTPQAQALSNTLSASDVDDDPLTYSLVSDGSRGTVSIDNPNTGAFTYTPFAPGARGLDTFTYRVEDINGGSTTAQETVIVDQKIMPLGDSITQGIIDGADDSPAVEYRVGYRLKLYTDLQNTGYSFDFVGSDSTAGATPLSDPDNEGHGGWTAIDIAGSISAWLDQNPADIILLHAGTNQPSTYSDVSAILNAIEGWASANEQPVTVIVARIIDDNVAETEIPAFNDAVAAMIAGREDANITIYMVDQESALTYPDDLNDDQHPTQDGYNKMADIWRNRLTSGLLEKCP